MDSTFFLYLARHTLETALLLVAPVLVICMVVGIIMTLLQAVTSIRDMTLTIIPKLLSMGLVLLIFGNWMLSLMLKFTTEVFGYIPQAGH
ncbi:MAG: flagellar biosynthetic protein FliQ [Planctomycetota bacterium]|jgi:flagellar biosynthetic protein FliQ